MGGVCQIKWGDTSKTKASYVESGFPAYSASGSDGFLPYFDHEGPGIVLSAIGAQCGKTWFADGRWSCIKNTIYLKAKPEFADTRYLYYQTKLPDIWPIRGAAQPFISQTDARGIEINLPDLPTQRKIAGILSAYDDLIDNNLRRIKILEQMAQSLYREWFVHFRFPGHESATFKDSELGRIPEGWEVRTIEELVKRIPVGKKYDQKSASPTGMVPIFDQGKTGIIGYHDDEPGVTATDDAPIIVFANHTCYQRLVHYPFSAIQNVLPFLPSPKIERNIYWLHHATNGKLVLNDYKGHWPEFAALVLSVPPAELSDLFGDFVKPISLQILRLERANQTLHRTRDLILPKLLSNRQTPDKL